MRACFLPLLLVAGCGDSVGDMVEEFDFGEFNVPAGQEVRLCRTFHRQRGDSFITRFEVNAAPGLVSMSLHQQAADVSDAVFPCPRRLNDQWSQLVTFTKPTVDIAFPDGSMMIPVRNAQLLMRVHYANTEALKTPGGKARASMIIHEVPARTGILVASASTISTAPALLVPPGEQEVVHDCPLMQPTTVYGIGVDVDRHVEEVSVNKRNADNSTGQQVYRATTASGFPFMLLAPADYVSVGANTELPEGFRTTCQYRNPGDAALVAGPSFETQAHCDLIFFHYRRTDISVGPVSCISSGAGVW